MNRKTALEQIDGLTDSQAIEGYVLVMSIALEMDGTVADMDLIIGPLCRAALKVIVKAAGEGEDPLRSVLH